ncbi:transposase family protein [Streptomyces sp. NPDC057686]|uniref:transposase family protein n=1 Tax=Streptomyces sp. NPDC057686 TaxID=3346212 RepID=UPI00367C6533
MLVTPVRSWAWCLIVRVEAQCTAAGAPGPECGTRSGRVHGSYLWFPADVPSAGRSVVLCLRVRRFTCQNVSCGRRTFVEQVPGPTRRHGQRTERLRSTLAAVGLALAGRASARMPRACAVEDDQQPLVAPRLHGLAGSAERCRHGQPEGVTQPEQIGGGGSAAGTGRLCVTDGDDGPAPRFRHDAALAQLHWPSLGGEHRTVQHPTPGSHVHVPAQRGGRSDTCRGVDRRRTTLMSDQHGRDHAAPRGAGARHSTRQTRAGPG